MKTIKDWAEDERPREKLNTKGATSLSDAELLAILINSGTKDRSALDLARDILNLANGNVTNLGRMSVAEFKQIKGVGTARAITIAAALELGRRRQAKDAVPKMKITCSKDAALLLFPIMQDLSYEIFCVMYLNNSNIVIKNEIISSGGITSSIVDIRMILKNALLNQATGIIISHNHPSGNLQPSESDKNITQKIAASTKLMDIKLLDHIIIANQEFTSFSDLGLL